MLIYHMIAFSIGIFIDWVIGDPYNMPHPIKWIGTFISKLDHHFMDDLINKDIRNEKKEKEAGVVTVFLVCITTLLVSALVLLGAYRIHFILGIIIEAGMTSYVLAAKSLCVESMKVHHALERDDIEGARMAVSMIVGRDTMSLDQKGIIKAAVETVAENTSDGVIAPLLYTFIGGPILGMLYKAINTMDSMLGYHNDRYEQYGFFAAKLDDIVNFIPARLSAVAMIAAAYLLFGYSGKNAFKIYKRDRYNHKSPNSAHTESVCAGALQVQLAGDASYFGKIVKKPFIGDAIREVEVKDIKRANVLMFITEGVVILCFYLLFILCL